MRATLTVDQLAAIRQAAHWYSQLNGGDARPEDYRAWQGWLDAAPHNAWAWQQAERLQAQVAGAPGTPAHQVLSRAEASRKASRRSVIRGCGLLFGGALLGWGGYRETRHSPWLADYRSGVGERRSITLGNGIRLTLDTASALSLDETTPLPCLRLEAGEVMVNVPEQQACRVGTAHGRIEAGPGRFAVRLLDNRTRLDVFSQQVRVSLPGGESRIVSQGQRCEFDSEGLASLDLLPTGAGAWTQGLMIANDQRLDLFLDELSRYRPGVLRCAPAVAGLRISGTFRLDDSEQILRALATSLPVRVERVTRYWVTVSAA